MKKAIFFCSLIVLVASCKEGWTNEHRQAYLEACNDSPNASGMTPEQRKAYCTCSMEEVMKHYTDIEQVIVNKDSVVVNAAMLQCRTKALQ